MPKPSTVNKNNKYGFEGDPWVEDAMIRAILDYKPNLLVETGTRFGATTRRLMALMKKHCTDHWQLFSSDLDKEALDIAIPLVEAAAVKMDTAKRSFVLRCCSADMIRLLTIDMDYRRCIFYLDAHWGRVVIDRELDAIYTAVRNKSLAPPVIFVHDFYVPGEKGMKYEKIGRTPLGHDMLREGISAIYRDTGYRLLMNNSEHSGGQHCGVGIFRPSVFHMPRLEDVFTRYNVFGDEIGEMLHFEELLEPLCEKVSPEDALDGLRIPRMSSLLSTKVTHQE